MNTPTFTPFPKIPRFSRPIIITEKIDGTNASVFIDEDGTFLTASRKRWITPDDDNFGFSRWAHENQDQLMELGPGHHFGEWYGSGIQRGYGLDHKRFALFNTSRWSEETVPECCEVVPVLYEGSFETPAIEECLDRLNDRGSIAVPGFTRPEGVVIFHTHSRLVFKKAIEKDELPKGVVGQ